MEINLPFKFKRIYSGPIAEGMVVYSQAELSALLTSPTKYPGQNVTLVVSGSSNQSFTLSADGASWESVGESSDPFIEVAALPAVGVVGKIYVITDESSPYYLLHAHYSATLGWMEF